MGELVQWSDLISVSYIIVLDAPQASVTFLKCEGKSQKVLGQCQYSKFPHLCLEVLKPQLIQTFCSTESQCT